MLPAPDHLRVTEPVNIDHKASSKIAAIAQNLYRVLLNKPPPPLLMPLTVADVADTSTTGDPSFFAASPSFISLSHLKISLCDDQWRWITARSCSDWSKSVSMNVRKWRGGCEIKVVLSGWKFPNWVWTAWRMMTERNDGEAVRAGPIVSARHCLIFIFPVNIRCVI